MELAVYSDAARTMLVDTLSVTVDTGRTWQYLYGANSYGETSSAAALSFDVENLQTRAVATEHSYYNESWQVLEEREGGLPVAQYLPDPRYVDATVVRWRDADLDAGHTLEETLYYCQDANWNVTAVVSAAGSVVERYVYDPYGKATVLDEDWAPVEGNQSAVANARLFQGEELNAESGLYSSRFRTGYHPTLGVWTSRDGSYIDGSNLYQYCRSNPVALTDPMGLCGGTAPGTTEYKKDDTIWDMGRNFDLIVVTDPKMDDQMRLDLLDVARKRAEEAGAGTNAVDILVVATTPADLQDAVRRRYEQLNPAGAKERRQLNILVIGHSDKRVGPYVGPGGVSTPIEEKRKGQLLPWWEDPGRMWRDSERAKKVAEDFPKSPISALKGMVKQITFSSCATAAGQHEKGILDEVATQLGARIRAPIPPGWTRVLGLRIVFEPQVSEPYKPYHEYIYDTATRGTLRPGE